MRILVSAYSCAPQSGSEPGAGYALVRAAAGVGECWVLTRENNVPALEKALDSDPTPHPVHAIGVEVSARALRWKRRLGAFRPYYFMWQRRALRAALELEAVSGEFDLVHHATMSAFWMPIGVSALPRPLVIGPMSGGTLTPPTLRRYLGWRGRAFDLARNLNAFVSAGLRRSAFARAEVVIAQNEQMMEFIERRFRPRAAKTLLVHSHASDPTISALPRPVEERQPFVLFVGRLVSWKGPHLALEAFRGVTNPDARLVFAGDGPERARIERRARRLGQASRVDLLGAVPRERVLSLMAEAACLLFPSFHDSAGFVVSEALSLGTPVVCLDHGGPGAIVRLWPQVASEAIAPVGGADTANALRDAIERKLADLPPAPRAPLLASVRLGDVIREAYAAIGVGAGQ